MTTYIVERLKLYGERNTSTNYLRQLLLQNVEVAVGGGTVPAPVMRLEERLPGREWVRDAYFMVTYRRNLGWKHRKPEELAGLGPRLERRRMAAVTLTKNPYSWLLSLHKRPYHWGGLAPDRLEDFLVEPLPTLGRENCGRRRMTPVQLWNEKVGRYRSLTTEQFFHTTTERLLEDPSRVVGAIRAQFNLEATQPSFSNYAISTKEPSKDFEFYRSYYLEERWRESLSSEAADIASAGLDHELMREFGYEVLV